MFNNILLVYSDKLSKPHLEAIKKIISVISDLKKQCKVVKVQDIQKSYFKDKDLIITAGGDGTFIQTSHFLKHTPILGINSEPEFSEGALTSINDGEIHSLKQILIGDYKTTKRQRIQMKINDFSINSLALNEVYVGSYSQFHTSRYIIKFNDKQEEQRSSGVLIVTGSGSSAWHKSAGRKPFDPETKTLKFLVREPFFGRVFNPKLICEDIFENQIIAIKSKMDYKGIITIDSNQMHEFNKGDFVELKISDIPLQIIIKSN